MLVHYKLGILRNVHTCDRLPARFPQVLRCKTNRQCPIEFFLGGSWFHFSLAQINSLPLHFQSNQKLNFLKIIGGETAKFSGQTVNFVWKSGRVLPFYKVLDAYIQCLGDFNCLISSRHSPFELPGRKRRKAHTDFFGKPRGLTILEGQRNSKPKAVS